MQEIDKISFEFFRDLESDTEFKLIRSKCDRFDHKTGLKIEQTPNVLICEGIITPLGMREVSSENGRSSRETIEIEWDRPLYTASSQDNADADFIEWGGKTWRVIEVIYDCTYVARAIRDDQPKCENIEHEAERSTTSTSYDFIRRRREG